MAPPDSLTDGVDMVEITPSDTHKGDVAPPRTGMYVTAKNLTSTVGSAKKKNEKNILEDLNFFLKPGSMVLMLGSPGCGKTSVFKALAAQTHQERLSGSLLFNGKQANDDTHHYDVSYVVQDDQHMAPFTVRETFKFSADLQMRPGTTEDQKNERVDHILKTLGLTAQADTVVGNEFLRGISGGQKKRVTIGVEMVKDSLLYLMDEPTTGLDSSTSLELMKHIKEVVATENISCLIALLQPGVEITKLFDFLMILSEGQMAYFGPMNSAISYFEGLGFKLPSHHNPAEFFQEIVDEPELYYEGEGQPPLRGTADFVNAYKNSEIYKQVVHDLETNQVDPIYFKDSSDLPRYPTSLYYQIHLTSLRAFKMLISNPVVVRVRIIKSIIMGLILGSLYYQLGSSQTDGNNRSGLIFFALLFVIFGGFGAITVLFEQRAVFYVQKDGKYYRTFAFFLSLIFSELPISTLETVIFSTLVYWMCGLQGNAGKFIYFLLMVLASDLSSQSYFKMVSAFSANATIASVIAPAILAPMILFAGFMIARPSIPNWWIWLYWISPIHYSFEGLMTNEHYGRHYGCSDSEMVPPAFIANASFNGHQVCPFTDGSQFIERLGMQDNNWFKWVDLAIVFGFAIIWSCMMYYFLRVVHYDSRAANAEADRRNSKRAKKTAAAGKEHKISVKSNKDAKIKKEIPIGCYMQWKNLTYEVDIRKDGKKQRLRLLDGINGYVKPGMLLALMGPSGAGKSTLLDVLADRKTGGHTKGEILINGAARTKFFTRTSAYVEQLDVLPPTQTVREAIQFSAKTRLPSSMPMEEKMAFVENILETLSLLKIANKMIGHGEQGLSLSQRKRVNIGIELASDPQLLFLDEPTSGLDSSAALKVMNLIKKIAMSGRSIICTIHQPSTSIFKQFDHLLLLKKGGETVYFGPTGERSSIVLDYFGSHGLQCDPLMNPADFILDVTEDEIQVELNGSPHIFKPVDDFKESQLNNNLLAAIDAGVMPAGTPVAEFHGKYSSTIGTQFHVLFRRAWLAQVRRVDNIRTRLSRSLILGVIFGTLYLQMDKDQAGIYNRVSLLFFSLVFGGMSGMSSIPIVSMERGVFYREQSAGMYRIWIWLLTFIITDLPWVFLSAILYTIPVYFISGLALGSSGAPFFYHAFISCTTYLNFALVAMLFAMILPTDEIAHAMGGVLLSITALFAGFMIPPGSIPKGWIWMYHINFVKYPLEIFLVNEFEHLKFNCPGNEGAVPVPIGPNPTDFKFFCPLTEGTLLLDQYKMKSDNLYLNMTVIFSFSIFFTFLCYLALKLIRHQVK
ncbi:ABC transporter G family protein [Heterostelium album PN500]|uniref:ABC transporter G family protein n=1 Tax=Heterostelium pallidum (strain ATCC 26659 / Pp 5 / PN500) TaxID=670386 RepID=D3B0Z9_HETP5|nr:ABC transporter G family protein [Heterostelium album PN500]EFA84973.1 ABC transporter G family protein [Heterostelium album PN500]|eukprot:XP_020437083.1 ABC transporter G family protein [Heterostelium album PN500]